MHEPAPEQVEEFSTRPGPWLAYGYFTIASLPPTLPATVSTR